MLSGAATSQVGLPCYARDAPADGDTLTHAGHPLEASRVFDIARLTSLPVLGVNYRKSVSADTAFPAPLQDVIAAYAYLVRAGYTRIALAGDSAGAGLGCALMQYLARLSEKPTSERPDKLLMPTRVCWYSPWGDLTFSHPYREAVHFDISACTHRDDGISH